jgi:hypothetical protein
MYNSLVQDSGWLWIQTKLNVPVISFLGLRESIVFCLWTKNMMEIEDFDRA